jgi:hypothetical protein
MTRPLGRMLVPDGVDTKTGVRLIIANEIDIRAIRTSVHSTCTRPDYNRTSAR